MGRNCPSVGTEGDIGEGGKPLWVLSAGVSSLSLLSRGGGGSQRAMGGRLGGSFEKEGRDEPGCECEGEWYFSGRGGGWNESFGLGGSGREAREGLAYIVSNDQRTVGVVSEVFLVVLRVKRVERGRTGRTFRSKLKQIKSNNSSTTSITVNG